MSDVNVWNKENLEKFNSYRHFPSEMILRATLSTNYFSSPFTVAEGKTVLDIGCLFANNLVPYDDRGMKVYGTEVTDESVAICQKMCKEQGINAQIKKGYNTSLPFEDKMFDLVLSIATIHYEENFESVQKAFHEFSRVTKLDGTVVIKTVAPEHEMFKQSEFTAEKNYLLTKSNDLRTNQRFYFFDNEKDLLNLGQVYFQNVEIARITEHYPKNSLDFYLLKCENPIKTE